MIIERGIAIPPKFGHKAQEAKALVSRMLVGDSVFFKDATSNGDPDIQRLMTAGKSLRQKHTCRKVEGGMRVWRIE